MKTLKSHNSFIANMFTLVELLVVIAIIAILASMLLPALNKAREKAKQAVCKSQLKQIGTAIILYVDSFDGYLPGPCQSGIDSRANKSGHMPIYLGEYIPKVEMWKCPSASPPPGSYLYYRTYGSDYFKPSRKLRWVVQQYSGGASEEWCIEDIDFWNYDNATYTGGMLPVHSNGRNILWFDGHVSWKKSVQGFRP